MNSSQIQRCNNPVLKPLHNFGGDLHHSHLSVQILKCVNVIIL